MSEIEDKVRAAIVDDRRDAGAKIREYAAGYYDPGQAEGFEVAAKIAEGWLRESAALAPAPTSDDAEGKG